MATNTRVNLTNVFGTKSIELNQYPPEAWDWLSGDPDSIDKADVKELSATVPWLYRGLNIIIQAASQVPICMVKGKRDVGYLGGEINSPFPYAEDLPILLRKISASVILEGRGYLFRDKARTMDATKKLWYWSPLSVTFDKVATKATNILTFRRRVDNLDTVYTDEQVIYFWPEDTYIEVGPPASSPAKAALCAAGVLYNVDQYVAAYFKRGAIKAMLLAVKGNPPKSETEKLEKWWTGLTSGIKRAFKVLPLNAEAVTPTIIGDGLEGLQDSALTQEKREDISTALGIPQTILFSTGASGIGGGGVMSEDTVRFYQMTVVPLCKFMADVLNKQQFQDTGYQLQVREEEMDIFQEDENARATSLSTTVNALADPELFLIAAAIQGYDLSPEVEAQIRALIAKKEADKAKMQEQLSKPAAPIDEQTEQPEEAAPEDENAKADLARLRRKALKNIGKCFSFESDHIPDLPALLARLKDCINEEQVKAIFAERSNTTPAPVYEQPDYTPLLQAIQLEVQAIKAAPVPQPPPNVTVTNTFPDGFVQVTNQVQPSEVIQAPAPVVNVAPAEVTVTNEVNTSNEQQKEFVKHIRKIANGSKD